MCLQKLAGNDVHQCGAQNLPSYMVYGDKAATGGALKTTPMMTSAQINASAAVLRMSQLTQDRLQVRPATIAAAPACRVPLSSCPFDCLQVDCKKDVMVVCPGYSLQPTMAMHPG